jgi:hypothetical protein
MLSSGLPAKVLVQTSDLFEETSIGTGRFAVRRAQRAPGDGGDGAGRDVRPPVAELEPVRVARPDRPRLGFAGAGAVQRVLRAGSGSRRLPPYLVAAAALQSRAFPAFSYEASAGGNWAARFSLENNPRRDDDWPVEDVEYVDTALQRVTEPWAFTFADFALCDCAPFGALRPPGPRGVERGDAARRRLARARGERGGTADPVPAGRRR